jgi:D-alanine-D-alanine ligase
MPVAISKDGTWLSPAESLKLLPENAQNILRETTESFPESEVALLGDTKYKGLTKISENDGENNLPLDVVFPVLHGTYGEDGTVQGLLEMAGIPYVGCGVLASSCGMDKVVMKTLFRDADLPICKYVWFL